MDFKNIHIGEMIEKRVQETDTDVMCICKLLMCTEEDVRRIYSSKTIESEILLILSKLLHYDFFRVYSQHLLLFTASNKEKKSNSTIEEPSTVSQFRKNLYTKEIIEFVLESVNTGLKTKQQIIDEYKIPKTTLYKWFNKYDNDKN